MLVVAPDSPHIAMRLPHPLTFVAAALLVAGLFGWSASDARAGEQVFSGDSEQLTVSGHAYVGFIADLEARFQEASFSHQFFLSRVHLRLDAVLNDQFFARVSLEGSDFFGAQDRAADIINGGVNGGTSGSLVYFKDVFAGIRDIFLVNADALYIGLQPSLWVEWEETTVWNNRFAMRTLAEQLGVVTHNDLGFAYKFRLLDGAIHGHVGVWNNNGQLALLGNGTDESTGTVFDTALAPGVQVAYHNREVEFGVSAGWLLHAGYGSAFSQGGGAGSGGEGPFDHYGSRFFFGAHFTPPDFLNVGLTGLFVIDRNRGNVAGTPGPAGTGGVAGNLWGLSLYVSIPFIVFAEELESWGVLLRIDIYDLNDANTGAGVFDPPSGVISANADLLLTSLIGVTWTLAPERSFRLMVGYRKTVNLDASINVEDAFGAWAEFKY